MPRRVVLVMVALVASVVAMVALSGPVSSVRPTGGRPVAAVTASPDPPGTAPVATDNPFVPADKDLSACVSAVPQPGCGSAAHGGWRQGLVFVFVLVALAFVGWRIVVNVRRSRRQLEDADHGR